jgi:predicted MFS family arabinose efflux permease
MMVPLVTMTIVQTMITMAGFSVPVFAVPMAHDLGIAPGTVGFYMSAVFSAAMVGAILGGHGVRRFGAIRMVQIALASAALALSTLSWGALLLIVPAAMFMGLAYGPGTPASSHILARTTPPRLMPLVFSIKQTGVPAGGALAGLLVPPMVLAWGWRGACLAIAAVCLIAIPLLQPLRRPLDHDRQPGLKFQGGFFGPIRLVLGEKVLRRMAIQSFMFSAVQMSMIAYLVTYLIEVVRLDLVEAGLVLAAAQIAGVVGRIFWGAVSGTLLTPRHLLITLGFAMTGASLLTAGFAPDWPPLALYGTAILFGATAIGWNGVLLAEFARAAPPGKAGLATGGVVFVTFAGIAIAPGLFGLLLAAGLGYTSGFVMLAMMALIGTGLALRRA